MTPAIESTAAGLTAAGYNKTNPSPNCKRTGFVAKTGSRARPLGSRNQNA
jgi:hypothetical protein